jgi:hypothetical protein
MRIALSFLTIAFSSTLLAAGFGPPFALTPETGSGQSMPAIALTDKSIAALWRDDATRGGMSGGTQPIGEPLALDPVPYRDAAAASVGEGAYLTWVENDWIYGVPLGANGKPSRTPILLAMVDSRHTQRLALGASRDRYLFVWPIESRLLATLVDASGEALTWSLPLMAGVYGRPIDKVAVASNGSQFLVVWETTTDPPWDKPCGVTCPSSDRDVRAIVVDADGTPRTASETILVKNAGMPDVVWTGSEYLVAWTALPGGGIAARRVSADGAPLGGAQMLLEGASGPHLASGSSGTALASVTLDGQNLQVSLVEGNVLRPWSEGALASGVGPRDVALAARGDRLVVAYGAGGRILARSSVPKPSRQRAVRR